MVASRYPARTVSHREAFTSLQEADTIANTCARNGSRRLREGRSRFKGVGMARSVLFFSVCSEARLGINLPQDEDVPHIFFLMAGFSLLTYIICTTQGTARPERYTFRVFAFIFDMPTLGSVQKFRNYKILARMQTASGKGVPEFMFVFFGCSVSTFYAR